MMFLPYYLIFSGGHIFCNPYLFHRPSLNIPGGAFAALPQKGALPLPRISSGVHPGVFWEKRKQGAVHARQSS